MGMAIGVGTIVAIVAQDIVILYSLEAIITDIDLSKYIPGDFQ
jgi:cation transport ATPase